MFITPPLDVLLFPLCHFAMALSFIICPTASFSLRRLVWLIREPKSGFFPPVLEWLPKIRLNFGALNCCNCGTKNLYFLYLCLLPLIHLPSAPSPPLHRCPPPSPATTSALCHVSCVHIQMEFLKEILII